MHGAGGVQGSLHARHEGEPPHELRRQVHGERTELQGRPAASRHLYRLVQRRCGRPQGHQRSARQAHGRHEQDDAQRRHCDIQGPESAQRREVRLRAPRARCVRRADRDGRRTYVRIREQPSRAVLRARPQLGLHADGFADSAGKARDVLHCREHVLSAGGQRRGSQHAFEESRRARPFV